MQYNSKRTGRASTMPAGIAVGTASALGSTFIFSALLSVWVAKGIISQKMSGYWIMVILAVSTAIGSGLSYHKIKRRKILVYLVSSGIYLLCLMLLTTLLFGGGYEGIIPTTSIIFGSSGAEFFLSSRKMQKRKKPRHSSRFC